MRARAELNVLASGRLGRVVSCPPVTFRAAGDAVYVVGTAAGPLGDDDIGIAVTVAEEATLRLRSAAATILYEGRSSRQRFEVSVGRCATLDWHPEPLIATAGCHHSQYVSLRVGEDAEVDWTEEVVLGRHGEEPGALDLRFDVDVAGVPLLRHQLVIGGPGWDGPAVVGPHRSVGLRLIIGPGMAPAADAGDGWAWMDLDGPGLLLVAVAGGLSELRERMGAGVSTR
ncbi:MAG: urease accessory protein UreD [Acidimicrobiales bacterium]